ncbi:MAG: hypothetical protein IT330_15470, partial [Anaerolineae bacterium]|nr:hypothetical protein [Anaerolineae bacterium]
AFYFSERYGVDLLGKSDRHIAHLPVTDEGAKAGHNKFDFAYSLGVLKPDLVIADFRLPETEDKKEWATMDEEAFDSSLYHDRVFREHCLPYPVSVESWNTIFICDWSAEMDKRENRWELQFGTFNHGSFVPSIRHPLPAA